MVVAMQPLVTGVLWLALIVLAPSALFWVALRVPAWIEALRDRRAERLRITRPSGPPLEKLVADLRRLRAELVEHKPSNNVRLTALVQAYDDVLESLGARLELEIRLRELPIGRDRDLERLRAESAIQEAGVPIEDHGRRFDRPASS
jgi:hypothetical protein